MTEEIFAQWQIRIGKKPEGKNVKRTKVWLKNSCGALRFLLLFDSGCAQERIFWVFFVHCTTELPNSVTLIGAICKNPEMWPYTYELGQKN